jgi:uncharacterized protein (TIGR00251 family)
MSKLPPIEIPASGTAEGIVLQVRLTPKSSVSRVAGVETREVRPVVKVQVTAPPEDGKANAAVIEVLAGWLRVPRSSMAVVSGHKSRLKSIAVSGDAHRLLEKLDSALAATGASTQEKRTR